MNENSPDGQEPRRPIEFTSVVRPRNYPAGIEPGTWREALGQVRRLVYLVGVAIVVAATIGGSYLYHRLHAETAEMNQALREQGEANLRVAEAVGKMSGTLLEHAATIETQTGQIRDLNAFKEDVAPKITALSRDLPTVLALAKELPAIKRRVEVIQTETIPMIARHFDQVEATQAAINTSIGKVSATIGQISTVVDEIALSTKTATRPDGSLALWLEARLRTELADRPSRLEMESLRARVGLAEQTAAAMEIRLLLPKATPP